MANPLPVIGFATAAPTDTTVYWEAGTFLRNSAPTQGGALGWVCTASGFPGTWKVAGFVDNGSISTVTAAAALTAGSSLYNLTGAGQMTLFSAASLASGAKISIVANGVTNTLNPAASQTLIGGTTLASVGSTWMSNGANTFYRIA